MSWNDFILFVVTGLSITASVLYAAHKIAAQVRRADQAQSVGKTRGDQLIFPPTSKPKDRPEPEPRRGGDE